MSDRFTNLTHSALDGLRTALPPAIFFLLLIAPAALAQKAPQQPGGNQGGSGGKTGGKFIGQDKTTPDTNNPILAPVWAVVGIALAAFGAFALVNTAKSATSAGRHLENKASREQGLHTMSLQSAGVSGIVALILLGGGLALFLNNIGTALKL
jgi:hypothetical protein